LFAKDEEKQNASDIVEAGGLHEERKTAAQPGEEQPAGMGRAEVPEQGQNAEGGEKKAKPRGHRGGIVGNAPSDAEQSDTGGGPRAAEFACNGEYGGHQEKKKGEENPAEDHEIYAEETEGSSIQIGEAAGVGFVEIAMRQFAVQDAFGGLAEDTLVVGHPAAVQVDHKIGDGKHPHQEKDSGGGASSR